MKKRLQKISMVVATIVLFLGVLFLNVEKNEQSQWEVGTISAFAQEGESYSWNDTDFFSHNVNQIVYKRNVTTNGAIGFIFKGVPFEIANWEDVQ